MQIGDLMAARKYFERATKINKKFAAAYNNIGAIYFAQKQYGKAIRQYEKALSMEAQTAGFYSNLGYAYFGEKRYPEAFKSFQKAMAIDPNTFQQNDRNGALMQYRSVSDHGLFDFMLAKSYAQMGDAEHCAMYLRRAIDEGYKEVASARKDPAFVKVLTDPDVKTVLDEASRTPKPRLPRRRRVCSRRRVYLPRARLVTDSASASRAGPPFCYNNAAMSCRCSLRRLARGYSDGLPRLRLSAPLFIPIMSMVLVTAAALLGCWCGPRRGATNLECASWHSACCGRGCC